MGGGGARNDALDPRGAFVLKLKKKAILWVGKSCPDQFISAGRRFLCQLFKYEQIGVLQEIVQGMDYIMALEMKSNVEHKLGGKRLIKVWGFR